MFLYEYDFHSITRQLLQMSAMKSGTRATLWLSLCAVCLLPSSVAAAGDTSSPHHVVEMDTCPSSRVSAVCTACSRRPPSDPHVDISRCCSDVQAYSTCRDQLDAAAAAQSKSVAKRSIRPLDDTELLDDILEDKRRNPFLGKRRANPFLGKRKVNPFLGKRRSPSPFLGKRMSDDLDEIYAEKRRMPFLG